MNGGSPVLLGYGVGVVAGHLDGRPTQSGLLLRLGGDNATTTYPNGTTVTNGFNNGGQETSTTLAAGATILGAVVYARDNAGQVASSTPSGTLPGSAESDSYTPLQQLAGTGISSASQYTYNSANDPTDLGGAMQEFDAAGQLCWSTAVSVTGTPSCTTVPTGATTFAYNANGQRTSTTPTSGTPSTYAYDQAGSLTTAATPSGSGTYAYNGDGLRMAKTVSGVTTQFTWGSVSGSNLLLTDGTNDYLYGPGGLPIEQTNSSASSYFVHDNLGSTIALTNSGGVVVRTYSYGPYGQVLTSSGSIMTPLQYGSGYTDSESGLIYLQHRYYDPATAEFLTIDPELQVTGEAYQYAGDDPVNNSDPSGLYWGESLVHQALNIVAVPVYAEYYFPFEAAKAVNDFGCSLGSVGCAASHVLIAGTPIPELEASGLAGDVTLDWIKNKVTGNGESIYDEDIYGSIFPRGWGGPTVWLPGLSKNSCGQVNIDFEW